MSKEHKEQAEGYFSSWSKGNSMQQYIACYHHRHGWEAWSAANRSTGKTATATRSRSSAAALRLVQGRMGHGRGRPRGILELPAKAYDLFYTWQQMSLLARDENENRARVCPTWT